MLNNMLELMDNRPFLKYSFIVIIGTMIVFSGYYSGQLLLGHLN